MAKRVNNINYKGIAHTPSLVSDNDGVAAECVNLAPDNGDLKPMPLPVKMNDSYTVLDNHKIVYVHTGSGYENIVELRQDRIRIAIRDSETGLSLLGSSWYFTNGSEIVAVQSIGDTLVVSTKAGTEYLAYKNEPPQGITAPGYYKILGQKPPMPVIEFQMQEDSSFMFNKYTDFPTETGEIYNWSSEYVTDHYEYYFQRDDKDNIVTIFKSLIATLEERVNDDGKFYKPFYVRYAIRLNTGDYLMQSPPILMLPSGLKCPIGLILNGNSTNALTGAFAYLQPSKLFYRVNLSADYSDWSDIVSGIDVFVSEPIDNYDYNTLSGGAENKSKIKMETRSNDLSTHDFGIRYVDGDIEQWTFSPYDNPDGNGYQFIFIVKEYNDFQMTTKITDVSLFHKVSSFDFGDVSSTSSSYSELPIDNLSNLANLPTLPDDYNSHNAVSPSLMQTYNNRLNMANISQQVFAGFENAYQPQSDNGYFNFANNVNIYIDRVYFKVKKNGKTYTVQNPTLGVGDTAKLDYTTYLYYPDANCFEAVVKFRVGSTGTDTYCSIPMRRHDYLNGSYWYGGMTCLGEYVGDEYAASHTTTDAPDASSDLWYSLGSRFMMSSVGNPWHFPVENMFDIGRGEIRALSNNAENMDAPQFGQNPIYVFSSDGTWTIALNADGTFNKLSYVSGDVIAEPQGLGTSPTASAEQTTFFKTERGIMMISGSSIKEIDLCMKGRLFNPKVKLLPTYSVLNGIPSSGAMSPLSDIINGTCDGVPYATFVRGCNLVYDYIYKRLMLYNSAYPYMYVYDVRYDFWSKLFPTTAVDGAYVQEEEEEERDAATLPPTYTVFTSLAMDGTKIVVQDSDGCVWYMGGQADENTISTRYLGFYVSKPIRFGTDDYKTLVNVVHDTQLTQSNVGGTDTVRMALYGSRDGQNYWRIGSLRGTSYKFFIIVLYTCMLPSSRYAYTAFEWEPRLTNKIR